jgi:hypothetical protein
MLRITMGRLLPYKLLNGVLILVVASCSVPTETSNTATAAKVAGTGSPTVDQLEPTKVSSQVRFSVEEPINNPVPIPEDVLKILRSESRNRSCLTSGQTQENIPSSWFIASRVNLNRDASADLLVTVANPCLFGANVNPFWIFINTSDGNRLVLSVSALAVEILNGTTNGSRDIRAEAATARQVLTGIYHFDGKEYRLARSSRKKISLP